MKSLILSIFALIVSSSAYAHFETFHYTCFSYDNDESYVMTLAADLAEAKASIEGQQWAEDLGGVRDQNYRSRGSIPYAKFGRELILERVLLDGGKPLNDGQMGGFARVEGEAEGGFYQYKFVCKIRAK